MFLRPLRVASCLSLTAVLLLGAADADAARKPASVTIVSPRMGQLVAGTRIRARLRVDRPSTRVRVFAGTKDVTRRFSRRGRRWTAWLPRSLFKPGQSRLLVQSRSGKRLGKPASVTFVRARRSSGLMRVRIGRHARVNSGPVGTRSYLPVSGGIAVAVKSRVATFARVSVNGRRLTDDVRAGIAAGEHGWILSRRDGVRVGRNRIKVSAWAANGRHAVKRFTVRRSLRLPLAEAGRREHPIRKGRALRLDASGSRAAGSGRLTYAWRVVKKPKGSRPRLTNANQKRPLFRARRPGVYQLALRVRRASGAAGGSATSAIGEDVTTVTVSPPIGVQGMWLDTTLSAPANSNEQPTLTVGGTTYSLLFPPAFENPPSIGLVLDQKTLAPIGAPVQAFATKPAAGQITLTETQQGEPDSADYHSKLWIGTDLVATNSSVNPVGYGDYALKGWLLPAGTIPPSKGHSTATGEPAWVAGDMLPVKTRVAGLPANANAMEVNGTQLATQTLNAGSTAGFQLVTLDNMGRGTPTLFQFDAVDADNRAAIVGLTSALSAAQAADATILVQGFGALKPPVGSAATLLAWRGLAAEIGEIGGNADVFNLLDGTTDPSGGAYALAVGAVTAAGTTVTAHGGQEMSFERTSQSGTLSALLTRDFLTGKYRVLTSDGAAPLPNANAQTFAPQLYGAPTSYASKWLTAKTGVFITPTSAEQAAMNYITSYAASQLWTASAGNGCTGAPDPVRGSYCLVSPSSALHDHLHDDLAFNQGDATKNGYTQADFDAAQETLLQETTLVQSVRSTLQTYELIFAANANLSSTNIQTATDTVTNQIQASEQQTELNTYQILADFTGLGTAFPEVDAAMTAINVTMVFVGDFLPHSSPQTLLPTVETTKDTIATEIADAYQNAVVRLDAAGDGIVSDPVKLQQMGNELATGLYALTTDDVKNVNSAVQYGVNQTLWGTLLGAAYNIWVAPVTQGKYTMPVNPECNLWHPFANVNPSGRWDPPQNSTPNQQWWIALAEQNDPRYYLISHSNQGLGDITDHLFAPIGGGDPDAVGLVMPYFALDNLASNTVPLEGDPKNPYDWGCSFNG